MIVLSDAMPLPGVAPSSDGTPPKRMPVPPKSSS